VDLKPVLVVRMVELLAVMLRMEPVKGMRGKRHRQTEKVHISLNEGYR
jgi:hypothetical protein